MIFNLITKAKDLFFNNKKSGLSATNTQDAIDEITRSYATLNDLTDVTKNAIKNVEIGGTNLLTNTNSLSAPFATEETYRGLVVRYRDNSEGTTYGDLGTQRLSDIEPNTQYTLSFYAKGTGDINTYFYPNVVASGYSNMSTSGALGDGSIRHTLTDNWTKYVITYTTKDTVEGGKDLIPVRVWQGAIAYVCGLKFEKGNKATDWSPAPSDAINRISTVESGLLEVNGKSTRINTSILTKALELSDGVYNYMLGGADYTDYSEFPHSAYRYCSATIHSRGGCYAVVLWGLLSANTTLPTIINYYSGTAWSGWKTFSTTDDLNAKANGDTSGNAVNSNKWGNYQMRTGTSGASGYITFETE